jgi:hypothetical protein
MVLAGVGFNCCLGITGRNTYTETQTGRAVALEVSGWLPTAAARVRKEVRLCRICGGHSGTGAGFLTSTPVSPATHSTDCSTLIIHHQGLVQ